MIDLTINNKEEPQKGKILVSDPFMEDEYFGRSVVLLCDHNEKGSFGFVLNNYIDIDINEVLPDLNQIESKLGIGGPVKTDSVFYIHTLGDKVEGSEHIIDNIYYGGDFDTINNMVLTGQILKGQLRFFLGYSGWGANQLEDELNENSWLVTSVGTENIMDTSETRLWNSTMEKQKGTKYKIMSNFPQNFRNN